MRIKATLACAGLAALLFCITVSSAGSSALVSGGQLWAKRYNGPANGVDFGDAVTRSPDGTKVFVTGRIYGGPATGNNYVTIAYNANTGAPLWTKNYNGPGNGNDGGNAIAISPDGSKVFVTGSSYGSSTTGTAYATIAYDASSGTELWTKRYNGPVNGSDDAKAVAVSGDGAKVFVTGASYSGGPKSLDYATVAYNATSGAQLWASRFNGSGSSADFARAIATSGDATKVVVTGQSYSGAATNYDYATVAYNASTGAQLWAKTYTGPGSNYDDARSIALNPAGTKVFVTGVIYGGSANPGDYATVAYNAATGSQSWARRYNGPGGGYDSAFALAVSGDGAKVFVTGRAYGGPVSHEDYGTVAYNASTGATLWAKLYNGPANNSDGSYSIAVDPAGTKVFVTGDSYGGSTHDYDGATVAYDASIGSQLWATRFNAPAGGYDGFYSLALRPDGAKVFVTGESYGGSTPGDDVITVAYQA